MVLAMSRIRHPNIHQVIGYCIHNDSWLLVSEYADNGSLDSLIHNRQKREPSAFKWPMRVAVCIGIARGLSHFHEDFNPRAVHRDIKPSNILLDANFTPKISDFDTVRFFPDSNSDSSKSLMGTLGYLDLEYIQSRMVTHKSDVYSFGVTMLEIISGRRPFLKPNKSLAEMISDRPFLQYKEHIVDWALNLLRDGRILEIIDPVLSDFQAHVVQHFIDVAFLCIKREPYQRPSMGEVMQMLDGACNSFGRQLLSCYSPHYFSAASSFRTSFAEEDNELSDPETEIERAETSAAQSNAATVSQSLVHQQQLGIVLSGTGNLVERLSQSMVLKKSPKLDFPEAVYPPYQTSVFQRGCSRHLYAFRYSSNTDC